MKLIQGRDLEGNHGRPPRRRGLKLLLRRKQNSIINVTPMRGARVEMGLKDQGAPSRGVAPHEGHGLKYAALYRQV